MENKNIKFYRCKPSQRTTMSLTRILLALMKKTEVLDEVQDTEDINR